MDETIENLKYWKENERKINQFHTNNRRKHII